MKSDRAHVWSQHRSLQQNDSVAGRIVCDQSQYQSLPQKVPVVGRPDCDRSQHRAQVWLLPQKLPVAAGKQKFNMESFGESHVHL